MFMTKRIKLIIYPVKSRITRILPQAKLFHWVKYSLSTIFLSMFLVLIPITADFGPVNQAKASWLEKVNQGGLNDVGRAYSTSAPRDVRMIVVDIIKIVLGFLGIIATVIILYAGFKWMTAAGNEENITSAKNMLIAGIIGLAIILSAYAIAAFTISYLVGASTGTQVIWQ
jgi:hypothetical protein